MELQLGDIIEVLDRGNTYVNHIKWAEAHFLTGFKYGKHPPLNSRFKVVAVGVHDILRRIIYGIRDIKTKQEYMIAHQHDERSYIKIMPEQTEFDF